MSQNQSEFAFDALSDEQKIWLVDARASGMSYDEMVKNFRDVYPSYMPEISEDVFLEHFGTRIKCILNCSKSSARLFLQYKKLGELPINVEAIPLLKTHVRLRYWQRIWDILEEYLEDEKKDYNNVKDILRDMKSTLYGFENAHKQLIQAVLEDSVEEVLAVLGEVDFDKLVESNTQIWGGSDANTKQEK